MIPERFRLDGQLAIVTGTHQGIGQAIAVALAEAGADIVAVDRSEPVDTRRAVEGAGRHWLWFQQDMSQATRAGMHALVARVLHEAGRLDILVNNAGTIRRGPVLETSEDDFDDVLGLNLRGAFFLSQAAGKHFVAQRRGKIVNVASVLSLQGGILASTYSVAKHGILGMTRVMANEWAPSGVNVNAVAPGYTETALTGALRNDPARYAALVARIPAGRWAMPDEIAGAALFLASPASDYCNGIILPVDGGWLAR
jgi:2-deoxy-D-gluconate 3-dehydrogenase